MFFLLSQLEMKVFYS